MALFATEMQGMSEANSHGQKIARVDWFDVLLVYRSAILRRCLHVVWSVLAFLFFITHIISTNHDLYWSNVVQVRSYTVIAVILYLENLFIVKQEALCPYRRPAVW